MIFPRSDPAFVRLSRLSTAWKNVLLTSQSPDRNPFRQILCRSRHNEHNLHFSLESRPSSQGDRAFSLPWGIHPCCHFADRDSCSWVGICGKNERITAGGIITITRSSRRSQHSIQFERDRACI